MSLKDRVSSDLKDAMKARDEVRTDAIRGIRGEIIKLDKSGKGEITDEDLIKSVKTLIKERSELVESAQKANRQDIVDAELARIAVLKTYLPAALTAEELQVLIEKAVTEVGAQSVKDMGKTMGAASKLVLASGKDADNKMLSELIKKRLS